VKCVDQATFRTALLSPEAPRPQGLSDGHGGPAGRRFDVYRNNVAVSLTEALETSFPVIRKLVGNENFKLLAGAFLRAHPPETPILSQYGATMPMFLESFGPTSKIGYLPDVARLEQAIRESYHAADSQPVAPEKLQALAPDELMETPMTMAPSLRLIRSSWPIQSIWLFNNVEKAPKPEMSAEDVVVLRPEFDPEPVLLPPGGGVFIETLLSRQPLGSAFEAASAEVEEFDLAQLLTILIGANAITKIGG